jgi:hypothetical protein
VPKRRWALAVIAVIGVALVVMPIAFNMFTKTPKGAVMIAGFKPYMTAQRLNGYQHELRQIDAGVRQTDTSVATAPTRTSPHSTSNGPPSTRR